MLIVLSGIVSDRSQRDGRRKVCERHETDTGNVIDVAYLADKDADVQAVMDARVAGLNEQFVAVSEANAEEALRLTLENKIRAYAASLTPAEIQTLVSATNEELGVLAKSRLMVVRGG